MRETAGAVLRLWLLQSFPLVRVAQEGAGRGGNWELSYWVIGLLFEVVGLRVEDGFVDFACSSSGGGEQWTSVVPDDGSRGGRLSFFGAALSFCIGYREADG